MGVEIERKFLLASEAWRGQGEATVMRQGYICAQPGRTVRVRVEGDQGRLTIKGPTSGATRGEWEYAIPLAEANELLDSLCERPFIEKIRHRIARGPHVWEVDEFLGANAGLIVAEIELASEQEAFDMPDWIGEEVTGDPRYYNASLVKQPYSSW